MRKVLAVLSLLLFCFSCKSPPPVQPPSEPPAEVFPTFSLSFDRIEAASLEHVSLFYTLATEHPGDLAKAEISDWKFLLNGEEMAKAALEITPPDAGTLSFRLELDLPEDEGSPLGEYQAELRVDLASGVSLAAAAVFPRIQAPEFSIVSIAIMQAELINTRFRVDLRIDNPNVFPVKLSSLAYELYGSGRFWADGKEKAVLEVPPKGSAETRLILVMNFINMRRETLDEVIAMGQVPYRFTGEALVDTGISMLPSFRVKFDRRGSSVVVR
jgi:LEA14-like dessication related protein